MHSQETETTVTALKNFIEKYTEVPDNEWKIISAAFERKIYAKNKNIVSEGEICRYFWFLEEGLIRFFTFNDGNDTTKFFTVAPYCFTSKNSFRNRVPARENIQTLEKCTVRQISLEKANELLELKSWSTFTRKFVNEVQEHMEDLLTGIRTQSAEQRYIDLQKKYPQLIQKIPLKHLSTFLGIAPQSLSRIRKKLVVH